MSRRRSSLERWLAIGDEVCLQCDGARGLWVDGPIRKRALILQQRDNTRNPAAGDLRKHVFRIQQPHSYRAAKALRKALDEIEVPLESGLFINGHPGTSSKGDSFHALEVAAQTESMLNDVESRRLNHKPVVYGALIQLVNVSTNWYLCVDSKQSASVHEPTRMRVRLEPFIRKSCFFRIMPRFRIRAEGEPVRIGDAIVLQSAKDELGSLTYSIVSQYDAVRELEYREAATATSSAGRASVRPTGVSVLTSPRIGSADSPHRTSGSQNSAVVGWTVTVFRSAKEVATAPTRAIFLGDFIRLYHKEVEAYLYSFFATSEIEALLAGDVPQTGIGLERQVKLMDYTFDPLNPTDSTSALTFWQIEHQNPMQGGLVRWSDHKVRLRHAVTHMYLVVETIMYEEDDTGERSFTVSLSASTPTPGTNDPTIFILHPVGGREEGQPTVSGGSYLRIQHEMTGAWLHASEPVENFHEHHSGSPKLRDLQQLGPNNSGQKPLNLRVKDTFATMGSSVISATSEMHPEDYFTISRVEKELVEPFIFVQAMKPTLIDFLVRPRPFMGQSGVQASSRFAVTNYGFPISPTETKSIQLILTALIYFCTRSSNFDPFQREGAPLLLHQTLLRETGTVDLLILMLQLPSKDIRLRLRSALMSSIPASLRQVVVDVPHTANHGPMAEIPPSPTISNLLRRVAVKTSRLKRRNESFSEHDLYANIDSNQAENQNETSFSELDDGDMRFAERDISLGDIKRGKEPLLAKIFRFIHRLLRQFLVGSDHMNQLHVARAFNTIAGQLELNLGAADTLMQLISG
ncbi:inositol 1,4,5-trisphosphate/ryanodine receptor-domain-containing protein [Cladochytrium replicatum]|nr:inositol 1,4,5-trisphosphate/ryanodine receptor-domain-containing protein [Cladochytrium replicatum]